MGTWTPLMATRLDIGQEQIEVENKSRIRWLPLSERLCNEAQIKKK